MSEREAVKEELVGLSDFKEDFVEWTDALQRGDFDAIIVLRNNKVSGVMVAFDAYQKLKAKASVVVLAPPVEVEGKS